MVLLLSIILLSSERYDSSIQSGDVRVECTARAVGRKDGLNAVSFTVTNKGKEKVLVALGLDELEVPPGKTYVMTQAALRGYKERQRKMRVYKWRNGKWEPAASGLVTVLQ